jgi:hypothetical protein
VNGPPAAAGRPAGDGIDTAIFKTCPQCGSEFQHWVSRCPDCDCELVYEQPGAPRSAPAAELPDPSQMTCIRRGGPWELRELAELLQSHGISCRIDAHPPGAADLGLFVREADREEVARLDRELAAGGGPADPGAGSALDAAACPACGEPLAADAESCASCGLEFPPIEI